MNATLETRDFINTAKIAQFRQQGFLITESAFNADELSALADDMDRLHRENLAAAQASGDERAVERVKIQRSYEQVHEKSAVARDFVRKPVFMEACRKLVGPDADLYYCQSVTKPAYRGRYFEWHQDSGYLVTDPLEYITCWVALTEATVENGCVWIIPGSHHWGLLEHVREDETMGKYPGMRAIFNDESGAMPVELAAGQVVIFSSLLLHKSGPNLSPTLRRGLVPQYHLPGIKNARTGQPAGDLFPVLRGGQPVVS